MLLRTLEIPLNLTTRSLLTARTAWTFRNLVIPLEVLPLETLFKHHVLSVVAPLVQKSLFRLSRRQHLIGLLLDLGFQVPRYAVLHVMALKAGLLSNHCENLYNGPNGLVLGRHGIDVATEAAQRKINWDLEGSKAFLVRGDSSIADSSELLYSLDKARKCRRTGGSWFVVW